MQNNNNRSVVAFSSIGEMDKWANDMFELLNSVKSITDDERQLLIKQIKIVSDKFVPEELVFK